MAIVKKITVPSNNIVSTLGGQIRLDEGRGDLVVYDPITQQIRNKLDIDGTHIYNSSGQELTRLDEDGLKSFDPVAGLERLRSGHLPDDTYNTAISKEDYSIEDAYNG